MHCTPKSHQNLSYQFVVAVAFIWRTTIISICHGDNFILTYILHVGKKSEGTRILFAWRCPRTKESQFWHQQQRTSDKNSLRNFSHKKTYYASAVELLNNILTLSLFIRKKLCCSANISGNGIRRHYCYLHTLEMLSGWKLKDLGREMYRGGQGRGRLRLRLGRQDGD